MPTLSTIRHKRGRRTDTSFGDRIAIVDSLLGGQLSRAAVCADFSISEDQLDKWIQMHARDRVVHINEFRGSQIRDPNVRDLQSRIHKMESMLRKRQCELRVLQQVARSYGLL